MVPPPDADAPEQAEPTEDSAEEAPSLDDLESILSGGGAADEDLDDLDAAMPAELSTTEVDRLFAELGVSPDEESTTTAESISETELDRMFEEALRVEAKADESPETAELPEEPTPEEEPAPEEETTEEEAETPAEGVEKGKLVAAMEALSVPPEEPVAEAEVSQPEVEPEVAAAAEPAEADLYQEETVSAVAGTEPAEPVTTEESIETAEAESAIDEDAVLSALEAAAHVPTEELEAEVAERPTTDLADLVAEVEVEEAAELEEAAQVEEAAKPEAEEPETGEPPEGKRIVVRFPASVRSILPVACSVFIGILTWMAAYSWMGSRSQYRAPDVSKPVSGEPAPIITALDRAKSLFDDGEYVEARELLLEELAKADPAAPRSPMMFLLAETSEALLHEASNPAEIRHVRELYQKAVEHDPESPSVPLAMARVGGLYERAGSYAVARETYEETAQKFPDYPDIAEVQLAVGRMFLLEGDHVAAEKKLRQIMWDYQSEPILDKANFLLARSLAGQGRTSAAEKIFKKLVQETRDDDVLAPAYEQLSVIAAENGDFDTAADELEKRLQVSTSVEGNDKVLLHLAEVFAGKKDYGKAERTCLNVMDVFPDSEHATAAALLLCKILCEQDRQPEALRTARSSNYRWPDNVPLMIELAELEYEDGNWGESTRLYKEALRKDKDQTNAWYGLGLSTLASGNLEQSEVALRKVATGDPSEGIVFNASMKLAEVYYLSGQPQVALNVLESKLADTVTGPRRDLILRKMGEVYEHLGLYEDAAETYVTMASGDKNHEALYMAGALFLKCGEWEKGLQYLARVDLKRVPDSVAYNTLVELGTTKRGVGNLHGALKELARAHEMYPSQRTLEGDGVLLRTYVALERDTDAARLVNEMKSLAQRQDKTSDFLRTHCVEWGDRLFKIGDYKAAGNIYGEIASLGDLTDGAVEWASLQQGNCCLQQQDYTASEKHYADFLTLFPKSHWKDLAKAKQEFAAVELNLRGGS